MPNTDKATNVRYAVLLVTTLTAFLLYLDRVCLAEIIKALSFQKDIPLTATEKGHVLSGFFLAYALFQVPAGWFSDRFGTRGIMSFYVALWSVFTALTGLATGFWTLFLARIGCGIAQAGAYPASSGLLKRWIPIQWRGSASSVVAFGGRLGGTIAPVLTVALLAALAGWNRVLLLYGVVGLAVAWLFWKIFREDPAEHPSCNEAERNLIAKGDAPFATRTRTRIPLRELCTSRSMWLMCMFQWGTNIGWVFLVTWLPTYLKDVKHVDSATGGWMTTLALLAGMGGMLSGGWFTDACRRWFGLRWGRVVPLAGSRFVAVLAYVSCLWIDSVWYQVIAFGVVAFANDLGVPATWAYMQDVGGRHIGAAFGWGNMWGNMWGNLGAWAFSGIVPWVLKHSSGNDWHNVFLVCAAGFLVAGLTALGINAARPLVNESTTANAG